MPRLQDASFFLVPVFFFTDAWSLMMDFREREKNKTEGKKTDDPSVPRGFAGGQINNCL